MGKINVKRVILAGIAAGLVFFLTDLIADELVVGKEMRAGLLALGRPVPPETVASAAHFLAISLLLGIALVWVYAAIRPRFGPGPRTAVVAGLIGWFFFGLIDALGYAPLGLLPVRYYVVGNAAWIVQTILASLTGGKLYKEDS